MNRRTFIQRTTFGTAAIVAGSHMPAFASGVQQSKKVKVGLIGCGWYGLVIAKAALNTGDVEVIAVCDVDTEHLKNGADEITSLQGSRPKEFKDYKELLQMRGMEVVMIGTPPQWHALQFIAACEKGLHIYCEKPLAYDVEEGKAMIKAAQKAGNIVQIGFQRRQSAAFGKAKQLIENGEIGTVKHIDAQIHYRPGDSDTTVQQPPASLDWEAWCGPAPKLPYKPSIGHRSWRLEKEYGNGHLVDWGIHLIDSIRNVMNFGIPESIYATGSLDILKGKITTPDTLTAAMNFNNCSVVWKHRLWGTGDFNPAFNNGVFFYGDKATLFSSDNKLFLIQPGQNQQPQEIEIPEIDMQQQHVAEFFEAVKSKNKNLLTSTTDDAFQSTAAVQLAMISYETGSEVKWDTVRNTITNNAAASKLLARPYREGYKRPIG